MNLGHITHAEYLKPHKERYQVFSFSKHSFFLFGCHVPQAHSYLPVLFSGRKASLSSNVDSSIKKDKLKEWKFEQPVKIPSYLIAIAAGELVYREMGHVSLAFVYPFSYNVVVAQIYAYLVI
jgi:hypothetical protein